MVSPSNPSYCNLTPVLFSSKGQCWKLADFGSAALATSKKLVTAVFRRGTEGYRAPEVLTHGQYNKRSDMFAVGCISYEIVTGQKLFPSDWAVHQFVGDGLPLYPTKWPPAKIGTRLHQLGELTSKLLAADPGSRPGAKATGQQLLLIRRGDQELEEPEPTQDDDSDYELAEVVPLKPVVQPSLRRRSDHLNLNRMAPSNIVQPTFYQPFLAPGQDYLPHDNPAKPKLPRIRTSKLPRIYTVSDQPSPNYRPPLNYRPFPTSPYQYHSPRDNTANTRPQRTDTLSDAENFDLTFLVVHVTVGPVEHTSRTSRSAGTDSDDLSFELAFPPFDDADIY
jgi:serine/threonine protein kinase